MDKPKIMDASKKTDDDEITLIFMKIGTSSILMLAQYIIMPIFQYLNALSESSYPFMIYIFLLILFVLIYIDLRFINKNKTSIYLDRKTHHISPTYTWFSASLTDIILFVLVKIIIASDADLVVEFLSQAPWPKSMSYFFIIIFFMFKSVIFHLWNIKRSLFEE